MKYDICPHCKKNTLFSSMEEELNMCNRCQDKAIDHANERAEWHYYHPPDEYD
jgi:uncharacterized protein (DUF983 family)